MRALLSKNSDDIYGIVYKEISETFSYQLKSQYLRKLLMKFEEQILYSFEKYGKK